VLPRSVGNSGVTPGGGTPENAAIDAQAVTKRGFKLECFEPFVCGGVAERLKAAVLKAEIAVSLSDTKSK